MKIVGAEVYPVPPLLIEMSVIAPSVTETVAAAPPAAFAFAVRIARIPKRLKIEMIFFIEGVSGGLILY
jgi:hypothetical protein